MVWGIRAPIWFGIALAALLLFVWCLLELIELEDTHAGLVWGLIVFGAITLFTIIMAIIAQSIGGGVPRAKDALTSRPAKPPRSSGRHDLSGSGFIPQGSGEVPQTSSGRSLK